MARTKDYEEYIEWLLDHGYDPDDYDDFDAYLEDIMKKAPPKNWNKLETYQQSNFESSLLDFFKSKQEYTEDVKNKKPDIRPEDDPEIKIRKSARANRQQSRMEYQVKQSKGKLEEQDKDTIERIKFKRIEGKGLTKTESKYVKSYVAWRTNKIINQKFNNPDTGKPYTRKEAMVRAWKEAK